MKIAGRVRQVGESATLAVQRTAAALVAQGVDVVDLGVGEPDQPTPKPVIDGAVAALESGFTKYTATAGVADLRDAIASRYAARYGVPWRRENVVVTAGAKQALFNVFMATLDPGDEAIIPSPCWVSFPDQIRLVGAEPRFVAATLETGFRPSALAIEQAVGPRTRAIVLNSPSNPTGAVLPKATLGAIVEIARARDLLVVYDETYERFAYCAEGHVSAAAFHQELGERLVVVNSFSKTYAMTGLRVGFVAAAPELAAEIANLQSHTTSNACSVSQRAALSALTGPQEAVEQMLREYRRRRELVVGALADIPGVELVVPEGAFYAFPRVEGVTRRLGLTGSAALAEWLLAEARVAVVPGAAFAAEGHLRISFAAALARIQEGLRRIRRAFGVSP